MTEYGKAIVEAAAKAALDALDASMASVPGDDLPPLYDSEAERAARATLLAAIDKLIETGPSDKMLDAAGFVRGINWRFDIYRRDAKATFVVLLRTLRAEIEEAK